MRRLAIPIADYHRLPHRLGWRYEYYDGATQISPFEHAVTVERPLSDPLAEPPASGRANPPPAGITLRSPTPDNREALIAGHLAAFRAGPDLFGYDEAQRRKTAREDIDGWLGGRWHPTLLAASTLALDPSGELLGALLVARGGGRRNPTAERADLQLLFVMPQNRRRGIGAAMLGASLAGLQGLGLSRLRSRHLLANRRAGAWYGAMGFREVPCLMIARSRLRWTEGELWRLQSIGAENAPAFTRLETQHEWLQQEVARLERLEEQAGPAAVYPLLA